MPDQADPIMLALSFSPRAHGATVGWEADVLGMRQSQLMPPYQGADLALVISALDVLQYPNYPVPLTEWQRQRFTFSADEQARLRALDLWDDGGRVRADAHQRVGRALYRALTADREGAAALDVVRNHAAALGLSLSCACASRPARSSLLRCRGSCCGTMGRRRCCSAASSRPPAPATSTCRRRCRQRASAWPLQILAIAPQADIPADVREAERAARLAAWQPLIDSGQLALREVSPATRRALVDAIHAGPPPDIVHYYGHGRYKDGEGALLLDAPGGGRDWTSASTLMALLGHVRLVTLFACQGAMIRAERTRTTQRSCTGAQRSGRAAGDRDAAHGTHRRGDPRQRRDLPRARRRPEPPGRRQPGAPGAVCRGGRPRLVVSADALHSLA